MAGNAASYMGLGAGFQGAKFHSTASTAITFTADDQAYLNLVGGDGWASAARVKLPKPEAGVRFDVFFIGDAVSSATKICSTGDDFDIYVVNDTTCQAVALNSTAEGGGGITMFGINNNRYVAWDFAGSSANRALQSTTT